MCALQRLRGGGRRVARRRLRGAGRAHRARLARTRARQRTDRRSGRATGEVGAHRICHATASASPAAGRRRSTCSRSRAASSPSSADRCLRPGRLRAGRAVGRRCRAERISCRGVSPKAGAPVRPRRDSQEGAGSRQRVQDRLPAGPRAAGRQRQGTRSRLRRPAERRDGKGHRPRRARRLRVDRAREALHHHRHGDGPGQDVEHECPGPRGRSARQAACRRSARRHSGCPIRPSPSARSRGRTEARCSIPCARRRSTIGPRAHGAAFEDVGLWKRARCFPSRGEDMHAAVARECRAVRTRAGIFDASTLGKIEVVGPDAAEFLNRIYTNAFTRLEPGRCRYGLMLKEDGYIFDDGVVARLAPDRFHVTTTTGGAARVLQHMEDYLQTEWPGPPGLPDLDHRAVCGDRAAGAEGARGPRAARRAASISTGRRFRTCRCASALCAGCRAGCSASRSRASWATRSMCLRLRPAGVGGRDRARASTRHHALRHRGDARAARGERASSSSARRPTAR